jgi:hypothetical protein
MASWNHQTRSLGLHDGIASLPSLMDIGLGHFYTRLVQGLHQRLDLAYLGRDIRQHGLQHIQVLHRLLEVLRCRR